MLGAAITHHPYAEHLYQAAMRVHAALGDDAAIRDLRRTLDRRLDEIDSEATDETLNLANRLITAVRQRARRAGRRADIDGP